MSFSFKLQGGDWKISNGKFETIEGADKLLQDSLKILLTNLGSNPFAPWYGSLLGLSSIGSIPDTSFVSTMAGQQISTSLKILQQIQAQRLSNGENLSAAEQLAAIGKVSAIQNLLDPRFFSISVEIFNRAFQAIPISMQANIAN